MVLGAICLLGTDTCERKRAEEDLSRGRSQLQRKPNKAPAYLGQRWQGTSFVTQLSHLGAVLDMA